MKIKTIVALVDLTAVTESVMEHAKALASAFHSQLYLIHVVPLQPQVVDIGIASPAFFFEPSPAQWTAHQTKLNKLRDELADEGIQVTAEQFQGMPIDKILPECRRLNADLIVMGAHHHSGFEQWLVGSVTKDVLKHAGCATLVIPDAELRHQDEKTPGAPEMAAAVDS